MRSLNLLVLRCEDLARSRTFYEVFGFSFSLHRHGKGPEHLAHEDERGVFELYPRTAATTADGTGLGFLSSELQILRERFISLGFSTGEITDQPWGRTFIVRDPDGRRVEVKEQVSL